MKIVEITYRYRGGDEPARERPADADAALRRMDEGSRAFAELFSGRAGKAGPARRVIPVDPRDLGLLPGGAAARVAGRKLSWKGLTFRGVEAIVGE
jgi:carbonic anhydrase